MKKEALNRFIVNGLYGAYIPYKFPRIYADTDNFNYPQFTDSLIKAVINSI